MTKIVGRGLALLRAGVESTARTVGLESRVMLAELASPSVEMLVEDFVPPPEFPADPPRIVVTLRWDAAVAPPCTCPALTVTATLTAARLLRIVRGGVYVSSAGEVPIPTLACKTTMSFWFEPLPAWPDLAVARATIDDGQTTFAFTAHCPGVPGGLRLIEPATGPLPRGGWIALAPTVAGHIPGEIRTVCFDQPGQLPRFHGPAGAAVAYTDAGVRFRLPPQWEGPGTMTIKAAMHARVDEVRGVRVHRVRSSWMAPQTFAVAIA